MIIYWAWVTGGVIGFQFIDIIGTDKKGFILYLGIAEILVEY